MSKFNRRDFLLCLTLLATASTIFLAGEKAYAQPFRLQTPRQNQSFAVGEQVQIAALLKTKHPRLLRMDFRANGALIGSGTWRNPRITWTPSLAGNYTITAEAISLQGNIISTTTTNVSILTVLYDKLGSPGNWGWTNQGSYGSWYDTADGLSFSLSTFFIGTLNSATTLRRIEVALTTYEPNNEQPLNFEGVSFQLKIWNANTIGFRNDAYNASLSTNIIGIPNLT